MSLNGLIKAYYIWTWKTLKTDIRIKLLNQFSTHKVSFSIIFLISLLLIASKILAFADDSNSRRSLVGSILLNWP